MLAIAAREGCEQVGAPLLFLWWQGGVSVVAAVAHGPKRQPAIQYPFASSRAAAKAAKNFVPRSLTLYPV